MNKKLKFHFRSTEEDPHPDFLQTEVPNSEGIRTLVYTLKRGPKAEEDGSQASGIAK